MKKGYTAAELVVVIGVFTVLIGISAPVFRNFLVRNELDVAWNNFNQSLYRAQALARNGQSDSRWGVYIHQGEIVVYQGNSYVSRNTNFDELQSMPNGIQVSGAMEYNFDKISGNPQSQGTTTLQYGGEVRTSTINSKGSIEQQ